MAVNDNFEVKITSTYQGDVAMNVLHYQQTAGAGGITEVLGKLIDVVISDVLDKLCDAQTNKVEYQSVRVQQVGVVAPMIDRRGIELGGQNETDPLPAQDAVLFVKRCNTGGRANVGKLYLTGVSDALVTGGLVSVGDDDLVAVAVQLKTNLVIEGITFAPIIWHRGPETAEFVTRCEIRPQISRQNRRHLPVY